MSMVESQPVSNGSPSMKPRLILVMGVSGSGKSSIALSLANALDGTCLDADDYHSENNIDKMSRGEALTDADRWPWLQHFAAIMAEQKTVAVGACSALRKKYRQRLVTAAGEPILFVYLEGRKSLIRQRMAQRKTHFMPDSLLDSQFATLEPPGTDELAISVDIQGSVSQITDQIVHQLREIHL
ncbi:MAG: gluconokinase [Polaribacter sp.]|jgi:gluconokinase